VTCSVDLADIIRGYHIELIDKGGIWRGRCPFCNQGNDFPLRIKKASGGPGDQIWECHQCGAAGNILTFIERFENINRMEALVKLFRLVINPEPKGDLQ
jgi:DNA primase